MTLPVQSDASELVSLCHWFRCTDLLTGKFRRVLEINEARARREAALDLGCCESVVRVEPCGGLVSLGLA